MFQKARILQAFGDDGIHGGLGHGPSEYEIIRDLRQELKEKKKALKIAVQALQGIATEHPFARPKAEAALDKINEIKQ